MIATFFTSATNLLDLPRDSRPHIAMVGRSNVGKSSMINHLTKQKDLARVSAEPGRTKTINLYEIDRHYFLVDLPGYGYAKTSKEARAAFTQMIHDYLESTAQLRLVLLVVDARIALTDLDRQMIEWLRKEGIAFYVVLNRMDKVSASQSMKLNRELEQTYPGILRMEHSTRSEKNRNEILKTVQHAVRSAP